MEPAAVLAASTAGRLKGLGGFRNILVHGYLKVDAQRVEAYLAAAPDCFSEFSRDIRRWLETTLGAG